MELINQTALPAEMFLGEHPGAPPEGRTGTIVAKATFEDGSRGLQLSDNPLPVVSNEVETPFGLVPRDTHNFDESRVEVVLLGAAYTRASDRTTVDAVLSYQGRSRSIRVYGDRPWVVGGDNVVVPGSPAAFHSMPLTWSRAYGGTVEVAIDSTTRVPLRHRVNPLGRGFAALTEVEQLGRAWGCAEGYPLDPFPSPPPNLEPVDQRLADRALGTRALCWATVPHEVALIAEQLPQEGDPQVFASRAMELAAVHGRAAHPSLCFETPPDAGPIVLENLTADGEWTVRVPPIEVWVDALVSKVSSLRLTPKLVVLLPEERRLTVTYTRTFRYQFVDGAERSLRLRTKVRGA